LTHKIVIGIGNTYRRDDGVGPEVIAALAKQDVPDVRLMAALGEPGAILEAWTGAARAVVVDAAKCDAPVPGRIRRWTPGDAEHSAVVSSHAFGLPQTYALGQALGRTPGELVVLTVEIADAGHGVGLTPAVAAAVPEVINVILAELGN
jgi:hydrogenase maturation protease